MYDIHTHLYWHSYDTDREEVLRRAKEAGIENMFVIGCTVEESRQAVVLAEKYSELSASVGIHPHEFKTREDINKIDEKIERLRELAGNKKVIAIGECGLDYFMHPGERDKQQAFVGRHTNEFSEDQKKIQKEGFEKQLSLAREFDLPVIVHCRDAYEDMFEILRAHSDKLKTAILHCYMGDTEITKKFLTLPNIYFSFTANITYPVKKTLIGTKDDLTETVKVVPLSRLFTETDCPFLAPQERRGERNEPAYMVAVVKKIADLKQISEITLQRAINESIQAVFKLAEY